MYTEKFMKCQEVVRGKEKGWVKSKSDSGGETLFGVARNKNPQWPGWNRVDGFAQQYGRGTKAFIQAVNNDQSLYSMAMEFFYETFWKGVRGDELPDVDDGYGIGLIAYDVAINSGPSRSIKMMQSIVGQTPTGRMDDQLVSSIAERFNENPDSVMEDFIKERCDFYVYLANKDPIHGEPNLAGWMNRLASISELTLGYVPDFVEKNRV